MSGVLCDRKLSVRVKSKIHVYVYKSLVRPAMLYGSGSQTVRRDAPVRRFNFPKASQDILVLCH